MQTVFGMVEQRSETSETPTSNTPRRITRRGQSFGMVSLMVLAMERLMKQPTLKTVWEHYRETRKLKERTVASYDRDIRICLGDWLELPVGAITPDMVLERHSQISTAEGPRGHGKALANRCMRTLRTLMTYAGHRYPELESTKNPVARLSHLKAWNKQRPRRRVILPHQMPDWFHAVATLNNETIAEYLLILLFMGARRSEAARLAWRPDIDFEDRSITFRDTKNGDDHILPMSDFVYELLLRRRKKSPDAEFVFEINGQRISDCNKSYLKVAAMTGIPFSLHDLRRSFISVGDSIGIPYNILKRLLNHRSSDVTMNYIVSSIERLRGPMQAITDAILGHVSNRDFGLIPKDDYALSDRTRATLDRIQEPEPILRGPLEKHIYTIAQGKTVFTAREIFKEVLKERELSYQTIATTVSRLVDTGWFELVDDRRRAYRYRLADRATRSQKQSKRTPPAH